MFEAVFLRVTESVVLRPENWIEMEKTMTHLCLVSDQPVPNLLPLLQPEIRPDKVVLAVSERMHEKAEWLESEIKNRQMNVERLCLADAFQLTSLQDAFLDWLAAHENEDVALNVTGGTKPMAIAAQEAFRSLNKPVFYVNVENDNLVWLDRDKTPVRMQGIVPLKSFLKVHGITMQTNAPRARLSPEWKTFSQELAYIKAKSWEHALGKLNYHAMEAERRDVLDMGRILPDGCKYWDSLLESLYHNEIIGDRDRLRFKSPEARAFANGGWLEHLVFEAAKELETVKDPSLNVHVVDAHGNKNELDVIFLSRNRLFIIECKTKRLTLQEDEVHGPAADAIYKLDSLRKAGGLRTRGILVSFRSVPDNHKRRAHDDGITVIDQQGLPRLKELLAAAMR